MNISFEILRFEESKILVLCPQSFLKWISEEVYKQLASGHSFPRPQGRALVDLFPMPSIPQMGLPDLPPWWAD